VKCRHCGNPVTWHEWPGPGGWVLRDYLGSICSDGLNHAVDTRGRGMPRPHKTGRRCIMQYFLVASSRTGATEAYRGADGSVVVLEHRKSGAVEATPVREVPAELTLFHDGREGFDWEPIRDATAFPAPR